MNMRTLMMSALVLAVATGCGRRDGDAAGMAETANADASAAAQPSDATMAQGAEAQAAAGATQANAADAAMSSADAGPLTMLRAVNAHEIAAAEQARAKNVDGATLEYANLMHDEHSKNQADTRALMGSATEVDSSDAVAMKQKNEAELATLSSMDKVAYEKAYIDAMVKGHAEVLAMLDAKLIPAAKTAAVQQHLAMTREHVAMHLEKARALQTSNKY